MKPHLDSDLLRTFLAIADAGSFLSGATRIHRSQSAASIQIKKLEDILGARVFERHGRGVTLSVLGEKLEPVARQIVGTLDETLAEISGDGFEGSLSIGIPDDYSKSTLTRIVRDFVRENPKLELSVHCAMSNRFSNAVATGKLDIAVHEVSDLTSEMTVLRSERLCWAKAKANDLVELDPVPVALFDRECWWRETAMSSLKASGRRYQVVFSSESSTGILAAVEAGIAVALISPSSLNNNLVPVPKETGFTTDAMSHLVIETGARVDTRIGNAMMTAIARALSPGNSIGGQNPST